VKTNGTKLGQFPYLEEFLNDKKVLEKYENEKPEHELFFY